MAFAVSKEYPSLEAIDGNRTLALSELLREKVKWSVHHWLKVSIRDVENPEM